MPQYHPDTFPDLPDDPKDDPDDEALDEWLQIFMDSVWPDEQGKFMQEIKSDYTDAIEDNDLEKLQNLYERIDKRISYLRPKMRDTEKEKRFIENLKVLQDRLLEKITRPEEKGER